MERMEQSTPRLLPCSYNNTVLYPKGGGGFIKLKATYPVASKLIDTWASPSVPFPRCACWQRCEGSYLWSRLTFDENPMTETYLKFQDDSFVVKQNCHNLNLKIIQRIQVSLQDIKDIIQGRI